MMEQVFRCASVRTRIASNPIGPILCRYTAYLVARGHGASPQHQYTFAAEHFGRWLGRRPINHSTLNRFLWRHIPRCRCSKPAARNLACVRAALNRLLEMLNRRRPESRTVAMDRVLQDYTHHLRCTCGLAEATIFYRLRYARVLLQSLKAKRTRQLSSWSPSPDHLLCLYNRPRMRGYFFSDASAKIRRTEVRPMLSWQAISDLLRPTRRSLRT